MSSTIKQAIQALKSRVADAFAAVEAKGGTLPATQDTANLPGAIASIPSGGATGYWQNLEQYGVPSDMAGQINTFLDVKLQASLPLGTKGNVPFVMCTLSTENVANRAFQNYRNVQYAFLIGGYIPRNVGFCLCTNLEYIVMDGNVICDFVGWHPYLNFQNCGKLRAILGQPIIFFANCDYLSNTFSGCSSLEEAWIEYQGESNFYVQQTILKAECLIYLLDRLVETTASPTMNIGSAGITRLNATVEGQAAIANAQAKGWNIV